MNNDMCCIKEKMEKESQRMTRSTFQTIIILKKNDKLILNDANINDFFSFIGNSNIFNTQNILSMHCTSHKIPKNETQYNANACINNLKDLNPSLNKRIKKNHFTKEEDEALLYIVKSIGESNWKCVSKIMKQKNFDRNPRQCKDRYYHYLNPDVNVNSKWMSEEDALLIKKVDEEGKKWKMLEKYFPGRTEVSLRNRYAHLSRKNVAKRRKRQSIMDESFSFLDTVYEETKNTLKSSFKEHDENFQTSKNDYIFNDDYFDKNASTDLSELEFSDNEDELFYL